MKLAVTREPSAVVVRLEGDFDLYSCAEVRAGVESLIDGEVHDLFLDLEGVTFLDSSGLGTLVGLQKHANRTQTRLALCALSPQIHKILDATHLGDAFTILPAVPDPPTSPDRHDGSGQA